MTHKKKTVLLISHDTELYGAPRSLLNIVDGLKEKVNIVVLVPHGGDLVSELKKYPINIYISKFGWDAYWLNTLKDYIYLLPKIIYNYIRIINTVLFIKKLNQRYHFDYIHSNSGVIRVGYIASRILKIPHIWHIREFQQKDFKLNILYGKKHFVKVLHYPINEVVAISKSIMEYFEINKAHLIYNGVMKIPDIPILYDKKNYFLYASSISAQKGIYDVLEAFKEVAQRKKTISLLICGTSNKQEIKNIASFIEKNNLTNRIKLLGFRRDITCLMREAKACIMASKNEAFGRVTVEAMFAGCPIIGYNNAGTKEIIQSIKYGLLYNSISELIDKMLFILNHPMEVKNIIDAAYERACICFSQEAMCSKLEQLYNKSQAPQ